MLSATVLRYIETRRQFAKPNDLPGEQPMKVELVVNLKTAKQIAVRISPVNCWAKRIQEYLSQHLTAAGLKLYFPSNKSSKISLTRSVQSQADSGLPTRLIPVAFRRVNHTFLYLYPRDK